MHQHHRAKERIDLKGYPPPSPYGPEMRIVEASGLRRSELLHLRVCDIRLDEAGRMWIHVAKHAGGGEREVPVLAGHEDRFLNHIQNLRLFPGFGREVYVQQARVEYATRLYYQSLMVRQEQPSFGEYNEEAVQEVMKALGHNNLGVVCRYYLRLKDVPAGQGPTHGTESEPVD